VTWCVDDASMGREGPVLERSMGWEEVWRETSG
jgi:hypothetical protein